MGDGRIRQGARGDERPTHFQSGRMEHEMRLISSQRAAGQAQARRLRASQPKRIVRIGREFIPSSVMKQLAALQLPKSLQIYNAHLRQLLRE